MTLGNVVDGIYEEVEFTSAPDEPFDFEEDFDNEDGYEGDYTEDFFDIDFDDVDFDMEDDDDGELIDGFDVEVDF